MIRRGQVRRAELHAEKKYLVKISKLRSQVSTRYLVKWIVLQLPLGQIVLHKTRIQTTHGIQKCFPPKSEEEEEEEEELRSG